MAAVRKKSKPARKKKAAPPKPALKKKVSRVVGATAATTSDILGSNRKRSHPRGSQPPARVPVKWRTHHRNLLDLRNQILVQIGQLSREANEERVPFSMHMADSGTDSFDRDFALSLLSADHRSLYEIEEALRRIENGSYGVCEMSGKPIAARRLEAIPWTRCSLEAQKQLEADGTWRQTHLAEINSLYGESATATEEGEEEEDQGARKRRTKGD